MRADGTGKASALERSRTAFKSSQVKDVVKRYLGPRAVHALRPLKQKADQWKDRQDISPSLAKVRPLTMVPEPSLLQLTRLVRVALKERIGGDFVECGVWRGGAAFLMADMLRRGGTKDRKVWLCDSFEGLPPPEQVDGPAAFSWAKDKHGPSYHDNCRAGFEDVAHSAMVLGLQEYTTLVPGWFEESLPAYRERIGAIALLRIDCDWHSSVLTCLENLYDSVAPGGFVIFDDYYTWDGCALAVHEFLGGRHLSHRLVADPLGVYFRKR
ncbi:MAG: hypothetical protein JWO59_1938 [Chloroflexi bacterium]|nr:hypothetical protein [Chloroflexota bacterium]